MGEKRAANRILVGKPEGKKNLEIPKLGGRVILNWIFKKHNGA
jgi:hypothetical protein